MTLRMRRSMTVAASSLWLTKVLERTRGSFHPLQSCAFLIFSTCRSQFYITFRATPNLDGKHTVFGKLVGGEDILDALEQLQRKDRTERPSKPIKIKEVIMWVPHGPRARCAG